MPRLRVNAPSASCARTWEPYVLFPPRRGKATWHLHGIRAHMRTDVPRSLSRQRAGGETLCSTTKRTLAARAPGRRPLTQHHQALLLGVAFNRYRLRFPSVLLLCLEDVNKAKSSHKWVVGCIQRQDAASWGSDDQVAGDGGVPVKGSALASHDSP